MTTQNNIERRYIDPIEVEFRASNDDGKMTVEGRPIIYESRTIIYPGFAEVIEKNAASEALNEKMAYLLWQHDPAQPMASYKNDTLQHTEDERGVRIVADCSQTTWGRDGYEAVRNGIITKMSFAFRVEDQEWEEIKNPDGSILNVRHIIKFEKIFDFSPVTFPAYNDTEIFKRAHEMHFKQIYVPHFAQARSRRLRLSGYMSNN